MSRYDRSPRKLMTKMVEKVWGRTTLPSPFVVSEGKRIGEIWFQPPAELDQLLIKYLFTCENLSVQVHPSASSAQKGERGKDECWLVLDAKPGAKLAIGFEAEVGSETIMEAAQDGSIVHLLSWREVKPGDVYFLPAGTVHAIGSGISLLEVQQNSDTTFRLYDYGRDRDLHIGRAIAVADGGRYSVRNFTNVSEAPAKLMDREHFRIDRVVGAPDHDTAAAYQKDFVALPLSGSLSWNSGEIARAGEAVIANRIEDIDFSDADVTVLARPN